jgi:diacylglycerol kinase
MRKRTRPALAPPREGQEASLMILRSTPRPSALDDYPAHIRPQRSWRERLRPACRGIKLGVRGHSRFFVHFFCAALVLTAAIVLRCNLVQWCLLLGCIGMVLITDLLNNAIEALFAGLDEMSMPRAAACLDIAAGAVLLAVLTASLIGGLIFLSRLLEMVDLTVPK